MCSTAGIVGKSRLTTATPDQDLDRSPFTATNVCVTNVLSTCRHLFVDVIVKVNFIVLVTNRKNPQHGLMDWIFVLILQQKAQNLVKDSIAFIGTFLEFCRSACCPASHSPMQSHWKILPFAIY